MSDIASYKELILADGPRIYLPLDAVDGVTDQSGNARNGAAAGGITIGGVSNGPGDALTGSLFDGVDDRITTGYSGPFTNGASLTYEIWVNRTTNTTADTFISSDISSSFALRCSAGGETVQLFMDLGASGSASANFGAVYPGEAQWVHVMLVVRQGAGTASLWLNGVQSGTDVTLINSTAYNATPGNIQVGARAAAGTTEPFDGKLCHFATFPGDKSANAMLHYGWGISTAVSRQPSFGLPQPVTATSGNFPSEANLPTGDDRGVQW